MWPWFITLFIDNISWIPLVFMIILILSYIYINKKLELFWFSCYYILCLNFILLLLLFFQDSILIYFLDQVSEPIVVSDPTIFTYNYFYFIFNLSLLISVPFLIFLCFLYFSSVNYNVNFLVYSSLIFLFIYSLIIIFWILKDDLFFSNWFSLSYTSKFSMTFDFQPTFEKFLHSFWLEYEEFLFFYILFIFIPFFLILYGRLNYLYHNLLQWLSLFCIYFIFIFFFFFEFSFINNFILILILLLLQSLFQILWLVLDKIKQYKSFL